MVSLSAGFGTATCPGYQRCGACRSAESDDDLKRVRAVRDHVNAVLPNRWPSISQKLPVVKWFWVQCHRNAEIRGLACAQTTVDGEARKEAQVFY